VRRKSSKVGRVLVDRELGKMNLELGKDLKTTYHGLSGVELIFGEVAEDALGEGLSSLHEVSNTLGVGLLEVGLDGTHVGLQVSTIGLLVEGGGQEMVAIFEVVDGFGIRGQRSILALFSVGLHIGLLSDNDVLQ